MLNHSSAKDRDETPHVTNTSRTNISNALRRRAESVINDKSLDPGTRALIRYGLEINDPWLAEMVRRVQAGETIIDNLRALQTSETSEDDPGEEKIEALAEIICCADEQGTKWAALLVLMAMLENAAHPKALANIAKHLAFARCAELNFHGMVDAQIAELEAELLADNTLAA